MSFTVPTALTLTDDQFCLTFTLPKDQWQEAHRMVCSARDQVENYQETNDCWFRRNAFSNGQYDETILFRGKYDADGKAVPEGMSVAQFRQHITNLLSAMIDSQVNPTEDQVQTEYHKAREWDGDKKATIESARQRIRSRPALITATMLMQLLSTGQASNTTKPVVYEPKPTDLFSDYMHARHTAVKKE